MSSLVVIGAGAWGSALSIALCQNFDTLYLVAHTQKEVEKITKKHPALSTEFPENIKIISDLTIIEKNIHVLIATPSYAFSEVLRAIEPFLTSKHQIAWATKGLDSEKKCFLYQRFAEILPDKSACVISGPTFAFEVAQGKPTTLTVASTDEKTRKYWAKLIQTNTLRAYMSDDIIGVEIGGAVKNILAIAAGIASGLGFCANSGAALITRGLNEMSRLGKKLGAKHTTFMGLSGLGDLVLTCSDDLSRNRRFGKAIAKGLTVSQALTEVGATVEGYNTLELILSIAKNNNIEMPICEQVFKVTSNESTPTEAVNYLMSRKQIDE
jgi:glycerol-3-phosphate dehydrogenase (NAD(P)+)